MWTFEIEKISAILHRYILHDGEPLVYESFFLKLQNDPSFRAWFHDVVRGSEFPAFRWETPGVTQATRKQPFEFVLHEARGMPRTSDSGPFSPWFAAAGHGEQALAFPNLGGDAILIVPTPLLNNAVYTHFAVFLREASYRQVDALFATLGRNVLERIAQKPIWVSTAGMGVSWLHIRIDTTPKYYGYERYRAME